MPDTTPVVEQRYRAMLLSRPGEDRLRMGCSMSATARALVHASVRARDPHASPATLRRAVFLRLYRDDFDPVTRERILAWLERDAPSRRVPVNWDDLELALTGAQGEWTYYLDLQTGDVQMVPDHGVADASDWPSEAEIDAGLEAGHLVPVAPLGSSVEYEWMVAFTETVHPPRLRARLAAALNGRGPFRRFKYTLGAFPAERQRWFAFRDARLRAAAREWLADHGIEPTTPPPTRPSR
jgi:hypothetical protein